MRILLTMPRYTGSCHMAAAMAFAMPGIAHEVTQHSSNASLLTACFNEAWALAVQLYAAGKVDAFAMIHSDIGAPEGWLDTLVSEMGRVRVDAIAAVVRIKDSRKLTSTAIETKDEWEPHRLGMAEVANMPATFTSEDVGAPLLLNTGLWCVKLGPWCLKMNWWGTLKHNFHVQDCIAKVGEEFVMRVISEDWDFSRQMRAAGLRLAATTAVKVQHFGEGVYEL